METRRKFIAKTTLLSATGIIIGASGFTNVIANYTGIHEAFKDGGNFTALVEDLFTAIKAGDKIRVGKILSKEPGLRFIQDEQGRSFDNLGVEKTYAETLARWFGFLANVVRYKKPVYFTDYYSTPSLTGKTGWIVLDPVNADNNITGNWDNKDNKLNEFASWFEKGRDSWNRIIRYDIDCDHGPAMDELVKLFGNPFKNHCEED